MGLGALAVMLWGCVLPVEPGDGRPADEGSSDGADSTSDEPTSAGETGAEPDDGPDPDDGDSGDEPVPLERAVDILFVIDNSNSMGDEQARLATSIETLVSALEEPTDPVDYRIAVTTTDSGNPWCGNTSPEGGALRLTSCLGRSNEFISTAEGAVDEFNDACLIQCSHNSLDVLPSAIGDGEVLAPRPWLERIDGITNLPPEVDMVDALRCALPQGINGCGYEQPLESAYRALERAQTVGDPSYGFRRDEALLAVIIVTDEADCSYNPAHEAIFLPGGNRVYWFEPAAAEPTSAVCWNAGVDCTGGPGNFDECHAADRDVGGFLTMDSSQSVLYPTSRYTDLAPHVFVTGLVGVPDGYSRGTIPLRYNDGASDFGFLFDHGVGAGCDIGDTTAVPPVRILEVAEALSPERNLFSICAGTYAPALETMGERILARLP